MIFCIMCAQHECSCIASLNRKLSHDQLLKMALLHTLNCTSERAPSEYTYTSMKPSKCVDEPATSSNPVNSSVDAHNVFDKTLHSNDKKSLYMSKACKYSFIASDYTSPEGQKLLSIKVYQKPPETDTYVCKGKNFSSKRSISEYFLSKNGVDREMPDERSKDNLLKSWQKSFFKPQVLLPHPYEDPSCDMKNPSSVQGSDKETAFNSPVPSEVPIPSRKSSYSLQFQAHNLNALDSEPGASSTVNEFVDERNLETMSSDEKCAHKNFNLNPNVNFKVFDIESLSESGEPCDNASLENNAHFGLDDAWFIPSARHTFSGADISGSASAAQLSIASSFGDSSLPICKICHTAAKPDDPLISPCRCTGTLRYIHCGCLMVFIKLLFLICQYFLFISFKINVVSFSSY